MNRGKLFLSSETSWSLCGVSKMTWNDAKPDFESLFSSFDGVLSTPWSSQDPKRRSHSISHKLGDYFSYEKEKKHCKQGISF